ncbi:hypothetical protein SAMN02745116_02333 [Pilibacter termitis]|uniref:Uncharacterized protein n=2 Tax=Pilibacter termitis TaxID=263852 RepID=A0A1T4QVK8_9ENTE|nr:hypothetical protein SAMN02745116_02333 [Pilibacter termitis]
MKQKEKESVEKPSLLSGMYLPILALLVAFMATLLVVCGKEYQFLLPMIVWNFIAASSFTWTLANNFFYRDLLEQYDLIDKAEEKAEKLEAELAKLYKQIALNKLEGNAYDFRKENTDK